MLTVSTAACDSYASDDVRAALELNFEELGGIENFVKPGEKVLLKVNLVSNMAPEKAGTTHPSVVRELAALLLEEGAEVIIGDSPGGLFNPEVLKHVYNGTGMTDAAEKYGAKLSFNTDGHEVDNPGGKVLRKVMQSDMVSEADKVISVCKIKTHGMMVYSGAVKNQYGTVPGTKKVEYHFRMPKTDVFADALIDIDMAAHPALYVMDAVVGMEGNGPTGGTPRDVGCILMSENGFALDLVASSMIGLERRAVPVLEQAFKRGLCPESAEEICCVGDDPKRFAVPDFKLPDHIDPKIVRGKLGDVLAGWLRPKVRFKKEICVGCGTCVRSCPAKALTLSDRLPKCNYHQCIRCYCCQELCPKNAVVIKESKLMKMVNKL